MTTKSPTITSEQYSTLDEAYRHFNKTLFNNKLPQCMILLHRKGKNNLGYFHPERFAERAQVAQREAKKIKASDIKYIDELSLNPDNFIGYSDTAILSTLAHEMAHVWQYRCTEKYPRNGYHDKVWGRKMIEIGLMPSNTGKEGGKQTGQQMHHYIIENGKFETQALIFLKKHSIKATSFPLSKNSTSQKKNKVKYSCPSCEQNAWAKPEAKLICGECEEIMEAVS